MTPNAVHVQSHKVLGTLWLLSLTPVQITVHLEPNLLGEPPRADILLLRREGDAWNAAQRARLPDGVRDSAAAHVLVEFKYTESVNETALAQAVAYDHFYRQAEKLSEDQVMTVLLSARTPRKSRLEKWGYEEERKGVFRSRLPLLRRVWLLALNRLQPQPHNAYVKIFASQGKEREAAFAALDAPTVEDSPHLEAYVLGLKATMEVKGDPEMIEGLTPEKVMELGEKIRDYVLETTRPEAFSDTLRRRILELASPEERLAGLNAQHILAGLDPKDILAGMSAAERQALLRLLQDEEEAVAGNDEIRNGDAAKL